MEGLIFIACIMFLYLHCFAAWSFYQVAKEKGYDESRYWVLPLFLPIAGYILVAALPCKKDSALINTPINSQKNISVGSDIDSQNWDDLPEI